MIQNANGGWIGEAGSSRELSSQKDLQWMLAHRHVADAVLVGSTTALLEGYKQFKCPEEITTWRKAHNLKEQPLFITATRDANKLRQLLGIADYVITTHETAIGVDSPKIIITDSQEINWVEAIEKLNELGIIRISCEGGPNLITSLLGHGLIDQFALTKSPQTGPNNSTSQINAFVASNPASTLFAEDGFLFEHIGKLKTWEELLTVGEYFVLRDAGTQAPFSVEYEKKPAAGYYTCRSCGARLFDATDQFDARCGWPAFWKPSDNANLILEDDHSKGYLRVEVKCGSCDSHLGHVFHGEGFGFPTDDRYCINAICLIRKYD